MRFFLIFAFFYSVLFGAEVVEIDERFQDSQKCKACHLRIVSEWSESWHSKSHYQNDEYFKKSIDYVARKTRKSLNSVKVQCATCHNPRISVTSTDENYEIDAVMKLDKGSAVNKAVDAKNISEGVNCVVCHNVNKIHNEYNATIRGINRVEWTKSGTMTGPYKDARSPYHKTIHHDFMDKTPNKLCFVCHANDKSVHGTMFTNMQEEYKGEQSCVECHMGPRKRDVAATYKFNAKQKMRDVRKHSFVGGHNAAMWEDALALDLAQKNTNLLIVIKNPQPHNIPSGFGARELLLKIRYFKEGTLLKEDTISLTQHSMRKKSKKTIPHLAIKQTENMSIPAKGERKVKVEIEKGATFVEVTLYYRLVNKEVHSILKLQDSLWSKKYFIVSERLGL
jgi:cytochrome c551/c552